MSAEAVLEVAVYMHRFHNLDLFQQGWYQIKVSSRWEESKDLRGIPSRVVQYEASDIGPDDFAAIWQINDTDHSFCTRPFRIKYARQDVFLAVMISFNLSLKAIEKLLSSAVVLKFELLYDPLGILALQRGATEFPCCAEHEFRIPCKALLGLHAYCPLHFDAWHMVLVDITVHSALLKVNSNQVILDDIKSNQTLAEDMHSVTANSQDVELIGSEIKAIDKALWKALYASRDILKHELQALSEAIQQPVDINIFEHSIVSMMMKKFHAESLEGTSSAASYPNGYMKQSKQRGRGEDLAVSFKSRELVTYRGEENEVSKKELLDAFQALGNELSALWISFLKFHRSNRSLIWEYLRGVWAEERSTEWAIWLVDSKVDIQLNGSFNNLEDTSSSDKQPVKRMNSLNASEEPAAISANRAELHRKTLEQLQINSHSLQDMQIFGKPSQLPILYVEHHTVACERQKSEGIIDRHPHSHEKVLRAVIFVHGFQGHHLDLRLVRNHWLLVDPNTECLMSETNEERTTDNFRELGRRLAEEVASFLKNKLAGFFKNGTHVNCRLSFVGHSIGNLIIRAALTDASMKPFLPYLYTFLSVSGPHLGYLYSSNTLFNSGLWLLKKIKASACMHQLTFTDELNLEDCYLFKLSQEKTFEYFQNNILLASPQDRYVPYHSARIETCQAVARDSKKGPAYTLMMQNCLDQILHPSVKVDRNFVRCDVNFNTSQARTLNNFIGRTAHIEFLETDAFLRFLMWTFPKFFS